MSRSSRGHSVSGDHHHHHRSHRHHHDHDHGYDKNSAYGSREGSSPRSRYRYKDYDDDVDEPYYEPRRAASRPVTSSRRHSPDWNTDYGGDRRGRRRHDDDGDYDPRDRYYLSGEEDVGFRSKSQPRHTNRHSREGDDYFSSRHRSASRRQSESRHHRHHVDDDGHDDYDHDHHSPRDRRGAPPMPRRQSSSAPPPSNRRYPPSASHNRHGRHHHHHDGSSSSKYPPSTAENRRKSRSMSFSSHMGRSRSKDGKDDDGSRDGHRRGGGSGSKGTGEGGGGFGDIPWQATARCALEAGTMAALKSVDKPGAWVGTKGAQVATAAVGAALIDGYIVNKNPGIRGGKRHAVLRQVTNATIGGLIMNPASKTVEKKKPEIHEAGKNFVRYMQHSRGRHHRR